MSSFDEYFNRLIAQRIRFYRETMGITQEELSYSLGFNLKYIGHIERCERKISAKALAKIFDFFKVQPSDFLISDTKYNWK